jgi:hypothetical protein
MTDQEINVAIAEACGRDGWWCPQCKKLVDEYSLGYQNRHANCTDSALQSPSYATDLNAMREARRGWTLKQVMRFSDLLKNIIQDEHCIESAVDARYQTLQATARQEAKAHLQMLGKWKD